MHLTRHPPPRRRGPAGAGGRGAETPARVPPAQRWGPAAARGESCAGHAPAQGGDTLTGAAPGGPAPHPQEPLQTRRQRHRSRKRLKNLPGTFAPFWRDERAGNEPEGGRPPEPAMCPARDARRAPAGCSCSTVATGPARDPTRRLPRPPPPSPQQPEGPARRSPSGPRPTPPAGPLAPPSAPLARPGGLGLPQSARRHRPPARRPYFIELALRGLAQGWVHGAPQGLDNGVGVHRSADAVTPGARVLLGQE